MVSIFIIVVVYSAISFKVYVKNEEKPVAIPKKTQIEIETRIDKIIYSDGDFIGVIKVPKIDAEIPIYENASQENLKNGVCHISGTSLFGETGNISLAGHRSYTYGRMFNRLNEVNIGDQIIIEHDSNVLNYKVYEILTVEPKDVWVLETVENKKEIVTLITCTPLYVASHRLIVRAELVY